MNNELKKCPFCGCDMRIESNRDWHRLWGDHYEDCFFPSTDENCMVPAADESKKWMIDTWNRRVNE